VSLPEECYFITTCVEGRRPVLADRRAAAVVIEALRWLRDEGRIRLLGFVVMADHLHVALALKEGWTLAQVMHSLKRHSSRQILLLVGADCIRDRVGKEVAVENRSHNDQRSGGSLWQDGYHDNLLRDRCEFEKRLDYMHDNPRRSGLVERAEEYPFSTAHPDYAQEIDWTWLEGVAVENRSHRKKS
jgi:REP element-mobilizing transposase RayT